MRTSTTTTTILLATMFSGCADDDERDTGTSLGDDVYDDYGSDDGDGDNGDGDNGDGDNGDGESTTTDDGDGDSSSTSTTDDGDGDSSSTTTTDSGDGDGDMCIYNSDCAAEEACVDGECYDTDMLWFDVEVTYYMPPGSRCSDGIGDSIVELYYDAYESGALQVSSSFSDCPASWPEIWTYDSLAVFRLEFWEYDISFNDNILNLCWQDDDEVCTRVEKYVLHDGYYYTDNVAGNEVEIFFYPRLTP